MAVCLSVFTEQATTGMEGGSCRRRADWSIGRLAAYLARVVMDGVEGLVVLE